VTVCATGVGPQDRAEAYHFAGSGQALHELISTPIRRAASIR
jgi:hypothetical protein